MTRDPWVVQDVEEDEDEASLLEEHVEEDNKEAFSTEEEEMAGNLNNQELA